jgi:hypothetical protein
MDKAYLESLMRKYPMKKLDNGTIFTGPVRISFPHLVKPRLDDSGGEKYEATLLFPLGADILILQQAVEAAVVEKFGANAMALVKAGSIEWPIKDQGKRINPANGQLWEGMVDGAKFCAARTGTKPRIVDRMREEISGDKIYPGCWCFATVHAWANEYRKDGKVQKRHGSVGLNNLQFLADDDRLGKGGGTNPLDEFAVLDGTAPTGFENGAPTKAKDAYDFG